MKNKLADRVNKIQPSFTLEMATIAAEMRAKGEDIINFSVGEPDFNTPKHIINAGKEAMDQGFTKYTAGPGMIEFRQAICDKLGRENDIHYGIEEILVSNGEKQSLSIACQALFDKDDKVVVFQPYWVSFPEFIRLADAEPLLVDTLPENNFEAKVKELIYLGDHIRSRVEVCGNDQFIVKIPNSYMGANLKEGATVKLSWKASDSRALDLN